MAAADVDPARGPDPSRSMASSMHARPAVASPALAASPHMGSPPLSTHARSPTTAPSSTVGSSPPSSQHFGSSSDPYATQAMLSPHVEAFSPTSIPAPPPLTIGSPRGHSHALSPTGSFVSLGQSQNSQPGQMPTSPHGLPLASQSQQTPQPQPSERRSLSALFSGAPPQHDYGSVADYGAMNGHGMHALSPSAPIATSGQVSAFEALRLQRAVAQQSAANAAAQEEISTIFVVGFPDDMQEREFQNMFTFSTGFEAATLKVPSKDHVQTYDQYGNPILHHDDDDGPHGPHPPGPRKQTIGFAKFRTRNEALDARDALSGRRVDAEKGNVLKAEMAKKNLHTRRGIAHDTIALAAMAALARERERDRQAERDRETPSNGQRYAAAFDAFHSVTSSAPAPSSIGTSLMQHIDSDVHYDERADMASSSVPSGQTPSQPDGRSRYGSYSAAPDEATPRGGSNAARLAGLSLGSVPSGSAQSTSLPSPPLQRTSNPADQNPPINTLYVGGLPAVLPSLTGPMSALHLEDALRSTFMRCLGFRRLNFRQKSNGPMVFVEFEDVQSASRALQDLYGSTLGGLVKGGIRLSFSKNPLGVQQRNGSISAASSSTPLSPSSGAPPMSPYGVDPQAYYAPQQAQQAYYPAYAMPQQSPQQQQTSTSGMPIRATPRGQSHQPQPQPHLQQQFSPFAAAYGGQMPQEYA